ncbi:zinc finger protein 717-like isoform X2 [Trichogramma pretiosum]|uniref:zinc finger protein 717-like isoform X2 n=1 Tax=Trichogramma pretiosum TaxID=7493 RepID=UPI000C719599|nr:zinc finger protein 717-like isoform X2 [Trichogramma pretiosum]
MDSSNVFNPTIRVKDEPLDEPFNDYNDYKIIDTTPVTQNVKYVMSRQENSIQELFQEYDENHKNELDDPKIEMECRDMKLNLLAVAKNAVFSPNQCQDSDVYKNGSKIKLETVGTVKKEVFGKEDTDLNFRRGLSEKNETESVSKEVNCEHKLKTNTESARNVNITPACDLCRKSFGYKSHLQRHIDSVHRKIRHECDICQKTFSSKSSLRNHIDSVHNGVRHACDICGNVYKRSGDLKTHVHSVHHKITYRCDECGKSFRCKTHLQRHINSLHRKITHSCDICQKTFTQKTSLKIHIQSAHRKITHPCDICQKTFSDKSSLKKHMDAEHNGITHPCDFCEKKLKYQTQLRKHVKLSHNGITYACETCGKTFGQKRNLKDHQIVHHPRISAK